MSGDNGTTVKISSTLRRKYEYLFFLMIIAVLLQLYMEYTFYMINQAELNKLHHLMESKLNLKDISQSNVRGSSEQTMFFGTNGGDKMVHAPEMPVVQPSISTNAQELTNRSDVQPSISTNGQQLTSETSITGSVSEGDMSNVKNEFINYQSKCEIESIEAKSAIIRTGSQKCKQNIADVACLHQENYTFAKYIPRSCPLKGEYSGDYLGCFEDNQETRLLDGGLVTFPDNNVRKCVDHCLRLGMNYAGLQFTVECWCGNALDNDVIIEEGKCDHKCPGNAYEFCGGALTLNIFKTGFGNMPGNQIISSGQPPGQLSQQVRIVFLIMLKGRGVRQIRQLFRLIYQPQHFYCIHVDESAEYMYRELSAALKQFTNVKIMENRLDTIWMGPNLLTAILNSLHTIYNWPDIKWDYVVNLGEKDFPLRTVNEFETFLQNNYGMSFLNLGNRKFQNLVDEKLMNEMFLECDNYIWHIGKRMFPNGLYVTGNSDRFCLHHNFVEYILQSTDELVKELKKYYTYSMMAAESFFSVVLVNSVFCTNVVDQNLHISHDDEERKLDCSCKHISDWCTCPPFTYDQDQYQELMKQRHGNPFKFFARQFDGEISQSVISSLENEVVQGQLDGAPSADSFWLNQFHYIDTSHDNHDSSFFTYYYSLMRRTDEVISEKCSLTLQQLLETNVFFYKDEFQGFIMKFNVSEEGNEEQFYTVETLLKPLIHFKIYNLTGPVKSFQHCQVGTMWDRMKRKFLNYGSFLGPESRISLAIFWANETGRIDFMINIVYIDPAMTIAGNFELPVNSGDLVSLHTPDFKGPLRPGVWNIQLLLNWQLFLQYSFVIIPVTHNGMSPSSLISDPECLRLHSGPSEGVYLDQDLGYINIQNMDTSEAKKVAEENSQKTGTELFKWIDILSNIGHEIKGICVDTRNKVRECSENTDSCDKSFWSTMFPDPKTDVDGFLSEL